MKITAAIFVSLSLLLGNVAYATPSKDTQSENVAVGTEITTDGPNGPLGGILLQHNDAEPLVIIIPGSGPTDRNGNNSMGVKADSYRLLAEALAIRNIASLRIDKRGMFSSRLAISDANTVSIADYASDIAAWTKTIQTTTRRDCVWLLGHSEGSLVALAAAQSQPNICGVISVAGAGRKLGTVMREQLIQNPANAPLLPDALHAIDELEAGRTVDVAKMHPALQGLFAPRVQNYLIDLLSSNPATLAASLNKPLFIAQGDRDLQVKIVDAQALLAAQPKATLLIVPGMTHTLKQVDGDDVGANMATYSNPALPISKTLVDGIAQFVGR